MPNIHTLKHFAPLFVCTAYWLEQLSRVDVRIKTTEYRLAEGDAGQTRTTFNGGQPDKEESRWDRPSNENDKWQTSYTDLVLTAAKWTQDQMAGHVFGIKILSRKT